jgi:GxxExxY protein
MESDSKSTPEIAEGAENRVTERIIGAAIEVHRHLGPGLLESAYEACLCHELSLRGLQFRRQVHLPVTYKGLKLDCCYKMDLVVGDTVVVEIKSIDELLPIHTAQLLTYLKSFDKPVGLLINFNVPVLKKGLKRVVNHYAGPAISTDTSAPSAHAASPHLGVSAVSSNPAADQESH